MAKDLEYVTDSAEHYYLSIVPQKTKEELRLLHAGEGRFYHTWDHVREIFRLMEYVDESFECLPGVILAAAYHDSVYNVKRKDNEQKSAALMRRQSKNLELFWVETADRLILATETHNLPHGYGPESDCAYFLDLDMVILGSPEQRYRTYIAGLRKEYGYLSESQWAVGRASFLGKMLQRLETGHLFHTQWAKDNFGYLAEKNMRAEMTSLLASAS